MSAPRTTAAGLRPHWSAAIGEWAGRQPLVIEIYAFGSRVKGGYRPDSDLDLAFVVDGQDDGESLGERHLPAPAMAGRTTSYAAREGARPSDVRRRRGGGARRARPWEAGLPPS